MGTIHQKVATLAATLIIFGSLAGGANAAVIFSENGSDLNIEITAPITFTASTSTSLNGDLGILFQDVYDTSLGFIFSTHTGTANLIAQSVTSTTRRNGGIFNNRNLAVLWGSPAAVNIGDQVTIETGVLTIPGFITGGGILPETQDTSVMAFLTAGGNLQSTGVSVDISSIPEPSSALLLSFGVLGAATRRRRNN